MVNIKPNDMPKLVVQGEAFMDIEQKNESS